MIIAERRAYNAVYMPRREAYHAELCFSAITRRYIMKPRLNTEVISEKKSTLYL